VHISQTAWKCQLEVLLRLLKGAEGGALRPLRLFLGQNETTNHLVQKYPGSEK